MKRLLNILILSFLTTFIFAQDETRVIDSIQAVLKSQEGLDKVVSLAELSRAYSVVSYEDCISCGEAAVKEAKKLNDEGWVAWSLFKLGIRYKDHYDFDLSHDCFEQAVAILKQQKTGDGELYLDILNHMGETELLMGELDLAFTTYTKALEVSEILEDEMNAANVVNNLAYICFYKDDFDKAMGFFDDARNRYFKLDDQLSAAQCDNNISNIYVERQQFDKALSLLQKAIPVFEQFEDEASLAHAYQNLGTVYATGIVNYDSAMYYLRKSIMCAENVRDEITLVEDEIELANVLKRLGKEKDAISLFQSALHSSETMGYTIGILETYKNLGIYYNETGDFTTSAVYLKRCMDLASEKGNQLYVNTARPYLIADYARLGQLMEMKKELGLLVDNYEGIVNENNALDEELARLSDDAQGLLQQYESQNEQIETLKAQRNQYRLAFFGLLAIALFTVVLFVAYKIVSKKRSKIEKG